MTFLHLDAWLSSLIISGLGLIVITVRYTTLLIGLLVALPKAAQGDRPNMFREFCLAIRSENLGRIGRNK
jgi:hypothetical protein